MKGKFFVKDRYKVFCLCAVIGLCLCLSVKENRESVRVLLPVDQKVIILDAGHGGWDPGKTGVGGEDEKNINLKIMGKLQQYLEQGGATVYITRATDEALGSKKRADMAERKKIANESSGDILVSIHQNAFPSTGVKGAQVFYHKSSEQGKRLAESVQDELKSKVDSENQRLAKQNSDYYILRTTEIPAIIVECGFLSNPTEEALLNDEAYQDKLAWAIYLGITDYFSGEEGI
ncbi:N-acetylmuramoyl-L-alanine amidase [Anaerotignum sp.]|uniref:N-acetylmuramoyl-L-alanine amidase n=1 Tax=Anaerotignum sp. TaxID=2039241 RepID=UPI002714EB30|nr:N-acetylmuramoyl-L-alanine amidase [Anaerotignum sp.]